MQDIKACTDKLSIMGKPMDTENFIAKVLKGLDYDSYKPIIDSVRAHDIPIIHYEISLKQTVASPSFPASVHAATDRTT